MNQVIQHDDGRPRYFLDTEFIEDGHTIDLVSIGIVCEDGREYYAANGEAQLERASDWVKENVLPNLALDGVVPWRPKAFIRDDILQFVPPETRPSFWGYYSAYDWVVFCQLFGPMIDLPKGYPMYCMDLKQYSMMVGGPRHPPPDGEHNALADARWNLALYRFLRNTQSR